MKLQIGLTDLLFIYLAPIALMLAIVIMKLGVLFILVKLPVNFTFKSDLLSIFDSQKNLKRFRKKRLAFFRFYIKTMLGDSGTQALLMYRICRFMLLHRMGFFSDALHRVAKFLTQTDISPYAIIGPGLMIYHGSGVVIGKNTRLGERCLVCQGVTTGSGAPQIGNNVKLWAGAKVLGNITVGDNSEVAANAVLVKNLPANCIAMGVPANRIIKKPEPVSGAG